MTSLPTGYKSSPLGLIPQDWEVSELEKVIDKVYSGGTPDRGKKEYYENGTIPWIKSGEVNQIYVSNTEEYITEIALKESSAKLIPSGTLLYALYGATAGIVGFTNIDASINQAILAIFPNENKLLKEYLFMWLYYSKNSILNEFTQGGQPNLSGGIVKSLKLPLPPLPEQTAIASILSTCDDAITTTQSLIDHLQSRHKALCQQLLTGKKRLQGFSEEWETTKLGDIFERITRKNNGQDINVLTISAQRGLINQENYFNKQVASEILDNYFLLYRDEFAYNKSYSNGYPMGAIKRLKYYDTGVVTTLYICFKLKTGSIEFFEHYFDAQLLVRGLEKVAHEGGRAHGLLNVTPSDFFGLQISIPSLEEQTAIASILNDSQAQIDLATDKLTKLKQHKQGLMQQLLTGKTRVPSAYL